MLTGNSIYDNVSEADTNTMSTKGMKKVVMETDTLHLFDIHQNPNDRCIVGHNIRPVLGGMFRGMEMDIESRMRDMTLADCITDMERYIEEHGKRKGTDMLCE